MAIFQKNELLTTIALHCILWGILIAFPWLFYSWDSPPGSRTLVRIWLPLVFAIMIFYLNYFLLIPRLLFKKHFLTFVIANIVLLVLSVYGLDWLREQFISAGSGRGYRGGRNFMLSRNLFLWVLVIGLSMADRVTRRWLREETNRKQLENEQLSSKLTLLNYQLQPHFFFNALNTIYALIDEAPEKAKQAIHALSKLMRYLLHNAQDVSIPVNEEIDFIEKFIALMKIRTGEKLKISTDLQPGLNNPSIPPLLLIPLVENAFKHGLSSKTASEIFFGLEMTDKHLIFKTKNTLAPKTVSDQSGAGIGLENLRKRLDLLFPDNYLLEHYPKDGFYYTLLKLPI